MLQIRLTLNILALLHKPEEKRHFIQTDSPLESHVKNNLFPPERYTLEGKLGQSLLKFKDQITGKSFCLEIKTCTFDWTRHIQWCSEMQLRKYLSCHKKTPTFLLLDIENEDNKPHTYYLLSMTQACHAYLVDTSIMHCKIATNEPVSSGQLWSR